MRKTLFFIALAFLLLLPGPAAVARECSPKDRQTYLDAIHGLEKNQAHYHERIADAERKLSTNPSRAAADSYRRIIKDAEDQIEKIERQIRQYRGRCDNL